MNLDIDLKKSEETFDGLLDEINRQKKQMSLLQSENRALRTNEIKLNKLAEATKSENLLLKDEILALTQRLRELEIQLTLPTNERSFEINKKIDPFPKVPAYKKFNWSYVIMPIIAVLAIFAGKYWAQRGFNQQLAAAVATPIAATTTPSVENAPTQQAVAPTTTMPAVEEAYLVVENPLEADGMVRVMDGYGQKARVMAWVNPGDKFRIREKSPNKMRRTYIKDGKNVSYDDYFYKISDKDQWIFGLFTNKKS